MDDTHERENAHQSVTSRLRSAAQQNPAIYADMLADAIAQSWAAKASQ
ncbi:hypothetical protein PP352_25030 [Mycobacteroides abscessus]|nr:hypothetical protein [Mycobacteroides abscessus]